MKELDRYFGATYSDIYQPAIMTETAATFPKPYMPTITDLGTDHPITDAEMTYIEKNNIDEAIWKHFRKKDVYK